MEFTILHPGKIVFGEGCISRIGKLASGYGLRAVLLTGAKALEASGRLSGIEESLVASDLEYTRVVVPGEPTVSMVNEIVARVRDFEAQVVIAVGGGSVLDAGKAAAAIAASGGEAQDYLEGVGRGGVITDSLPFIAAPTTAGTGSEATKNAVITDDAGTFKKSIRADVMVPDLALVDPDLTLDAPGWVTAACGMDALVQNLESAISRNSNPITREWSFAGLTDALHCLPKLSIDLQDREARRHMALASLRGGLALANAGLGVVHALASPLGAYYPVPHGVACAALLPAALRANLQTALRVGGTSMQSFTKVFSYKFHNGIRQIIDNEGCPEDFRTFWLKELAKPVHDGNELPGYMEALNRWLKIPRLGEFGITEKDVGKIAQGAGGGNLTTNPLVLDIADLVSIIAESL